MTLQDIASWISRGIRNKLAEEQIVLLMDAIQRLAFDSTCLAFKKYETMTIYQKLSVASFSVAPVAGDVGLPLVGDDSAAEGVIISYETDADDPYVIVESEDTFEDGEGFTITGGTGVGTLAATDAQAGHLGPYSFPAYDDGKTKVRKFIGVTTVSDAALFGTETDASESDDYGMLPRGANRNNLYKDGRPDEVRGTFTFTTAPVQSDSHRWVFFEEPPAITGLDTDNDANLLLPERYHMNFAQACIKCGNMFLRGKPYGRADVVEDFGPWWEALRKKFTPTGRSRNLTQNGGQSASVIV